MNAEDYLRRIGERRPLVHHITNWVTISDCAQATRNVGALPVMAHAREEVAEMVGLASALVLNIGTLKSDLIDSMLVAGGAARTKGIPVILDAVGCGATSMRTDATRRLLSELDVTILKGNAGEVAVVAGMDAEVRGVESIAHAGNIRGSAQKVEKMHGCVVVVTTPST